MTPELRPPKSLPRAIDEKECLLFGLSNLQALSSLLGIPASELRCLSRRTDNYIKFKTITGGKPRDISKPLSRLEAIQHYFDAQMSRLSTPDYLHSGIRRRSHVTHASSHENGRWLCKLDLKSFFVQVTTSRVQRLFQDRFECHGRVAKLLADLCTTDGHLPIGAKISQRLAFFAAQPMFDDLQDLAISADVRFTLYVDDLCFSGERATPAFLWEACKIVHHHGYRYHKDKCYRPGQPRLVAGVMLTDQGTTIRSRDMLGIRQELATLNERHRTREELLALRGRISAAVGVDRRYRSALIAVNTKLLACAVLGAARPAATQLPAASAASSRSLPHDPPSKLNAADFADLEFIHGAKALKSP